ncbi:MAG: hypothetical protein K2Q01_07830, partial [Rickettsiales bacterium]|nr:hypothetical protein [Rickettsiales bacterium]
DDAGNPQLLLLTPVHDKFIDSPLMLPALHQETITKDGATMQLRLMPGVNTNVPRPERLRLLSLLEKAGLYSEDKLDIKNVGLYTFEHDGRTISVPMVFDWGSASVDDPGTLAKAFDQPELADWKLAHDHIRKRAKPIQGVTEPAFIQHRNDGTDGTSAGGTHASTLEAANALPGDVSTHKSLLSALSAKGLYPEEIATLYHRAVQESALGRDFDQVLLEQVRALDTTQHQGNRR